MTLALDDDRWTEISPSPHDHERKGLDLVRQLLPNEAPYRAWSNFEFRDDRGRWHEVDLLVLAKDQLHLVELKHYRGILRGDDHHWRRDGYHGGSDRSPYWSLRSEPRRVVRTAPECQTATAVFRFG